jgi:hypothetical protein
MTRDDVYAVLVLLTELERTLFPGRDPGDSGGYTVDPGVPPPLPPTGVPGGWSADARGGPVAFDAWVGRAQGPAPYRASAERSPASSSVVAPEPEQARAGTPAPAAPPQAAGTPGARPVRGVPAPPSGPAHRAEADLPSLPDAPAAPVRPADAHRLPPPGRAPTSGAVPAVAADRPRRPAPEITASGERPAVGSPSSVIAPRVPLPGAGGVSPQVAAPIPPGQAGSRRRPGRPAPTHRPEAERRDTPEGRRPTAPPTSPGAGRTFSPHAADVRPARRAPVPEHRRRARSPSRPPDPRHGAGPRLPLGPPPIDLAAPAVSALVPGRTPSPPDEPPSSPTAPTSWSPVRQARTVQVGRRAVRLTPLQAVRAHRAVTVGYLDRVLRRLS